MTIVTVIIIIMKIIMIIITIVVVVVVVIIILQLEAVLRQPHVREDLLGPRTLASSREALHPQPNATDSNTDTTNSNHDNNNKY